MQQNALSAIDISNLRFTGCSGKKTRVKSKVTV
ncbi:Uncharacterised protein [Vibrio cholerae]|nr:Uncharacterised protein [Vibrio cholerae]